MMPRPIRLLSVCGAAVLLVGVVGCGSGDDDGNLSSIPLASTPPKEVVADGPRNLVLVNLQSPVVVSSGSGFPVRASVAFSGDGAPFTDVGWRLVRVDGNQRTVLRSGSIPVLGAGETTTLDVTVTVTGSNGEQVVLCFEIDPDDEHAESDESDNDEAVTVTVSVPSGNG